MKHLIILGDGMSDYPVASLGGKTPLQYARTPNMDRMATMGRSGLLQTIPHGLAPGSEVANATILGYDMTRVYEGRGPLEAASIGYEMQPGDMAMRCNILTLTPEGTIENHHGGHLTTEEGREIIETLQRELGSERVLFIPGIQYRHLLVIKGGNKHIVTAPPHDHPGEDWRSLLPAPDGTSEENDAAAMTAAETATLLTDLIVRSQKIIAGHPVAMRHKAEGRPAPVSIWPWSQGYRPAMQPLGEMYPDIRKGSVITAVDLIRGIGRYAGLRLIDVEGATGLADTNYKGKCEAALEALKDEDFVYLHVEAADEAGHDGNVALKVQTIENLDRYVVGPVLDTLAQWDEPVVVALMPDHATPVELRVHKGEPVPFTVWYGDIEPDSVAVYDENACSKGGYGTLRLNQFMDMFMNIR